jgi:hypothetical protein
MSEVAAASPNGGLVPTDEVVERRITAEESVPATPEEVGDEDDPQASPKEGESEPERQKRLSGYERQRRARLRAEETADVLLQRVRELESQRPVQHKSEPKPEPQEDKEPQKIDFRIPDTDTYDQEPYDQAHRLWERRQIEKEILGKIKAEQQAERDKEEKAKTLKSWQERHASTIKKYDDWGDVLSSKTAKELVVSPEIQEAINIGDFGADLVYHFVTNPRDAERISSLPAYLQFRELQKLEAQFAQEESAEQKEDEDEPPAPPVSKAPAPITPIHKPSPAAKQPSILDPGLSYKEFVKLREAQLKRK